MRRMQRQVAAFVHCYRMLGGLGLAALALSAGCGLESPKAPSWDTVATIPVINRTYTSSELLKKLASDHIVFDDTGSAFVRIERAIDTVRFDRLLEIEETAAEYAEQIGPIRLQTPTAQEVQFALADYISLAAGVVPDTGLSVLKEIGQPSTFSSATFLEGSAQLTVVNNTGLELDSLSGAVVDRNGGNLGSFVVPGGLGDGEQYSTFVPLAGKTITGALDAVLYFHTTGGTVLTLAGRQIELSVEYSETITAESVTGYVADFSSSYRQKVGFDDELSPQQMRLSEGILELTVINTLPVTTVFDVSLPTVASAGVPLQFSLSSQPHGVTNQSVDLRGYTVEATADSIEAFITANVLNSGPNLVTLRSTDEVHCAYRLHSLRIEDAIGTVRPTEIEWLQADIDIVIPAGFESVELNLAGLEVVVLNGSELTGDASVSLNANNGKSALLTGSVGAGSVSNPTRQTLHSSDAADLLVPFPNSLTINGSSRLGAELSTVRLTSDDFLDIYVIITAPLILKVAQSTVDGESNSVKVGSSVAERAERLNHGVFTGTIANRLPLGAEIYLHISDDESTIFTQPLTVIGPLSVQAAPVNAQGIAAYEVVTQSVITLSTDDLSVLRNERLFAAPRLHLPGTGEQTVRIGAHDYLTIHGIIEINLRIGGEG